MGRGVRGGGVRLPVAADDAGAGASAGAVRQLPCYGEVFVRRYRLEFTVGQMNWFFKKVV